MIREAMVLGVATILGGNAWGEPRTHPLVVAHRGFSSVYPENTLASVRAAVELGADWVEIDTYLSKDQVPVLLHDRTLNRTVGRPGKVQEFTAAELGAMDAGSWKDPRFQGEKIPTLREALAETQGRSILVIEIKQVDMESQVLDLIQEMNAYHDVMIFSFHASVIAKIHELEPRLPSTWLLGSLPSEPLAQRRVLDTAAKLGASCVGISERDFAEGFVRICHLAGFPLAVWTVDDPEMQQRLIRAGVDYIITNKPDQLIEILDNAQ